MDASRYFEEMHRAMSAQKNNSSLLLTVKVQDLGGADAYLELRQSPNGRAQVFYSTMGRRNLNFQLFRKGWSWAIESCHHKRLLRREKPFLFTTNSFVSIPKFPKYLGFCQTYSCILLSHML